MIYFEGEFPRVNDYDLPEAECNLVDATVREHFTSDHTRVAVNSKRQYQAQVRSDKAGGRYEYISLPWENLFGQ